MEGNADMSNRLCFTMYERVFERFGEQGIRGSMLRENGEEKLTRLMGSLIQPDATLPLRILEIGTCQCVSAIILSRFGDVHTFDVREKPLTHELYQAFHETGNVYRKVIPDPKELRSEIRALLDTARFDVAFIDGRHTAKAIEKDFELTRGIGRLIFHDYWPHDERRARRFADVIAFVDGLQECRLTKLEPFVLWEPAT